ncbi:hypothetical protein V493_04424 [Pseudogymnoascus sp. VKM F-4281 (FW-2241)]|nr:hypothetical protein V493_04424 [Pseudogymnoascus sp. VKM F-4281 (FW-2241)]
MAASLVFRPGNHYLGDRSDQTTNIQLYSGKEFTVKRTTGDQTPSYDLVTSVDGSSCMRLGSALVSSDHFRIYNIQYEDADGIASMFYCEDLGSANGTYVNNNLVGRRSRPGNPYLLSDGDTITLRPTYSLEFKQSIEKQRGEMDALQLQETVSFAKRYSITDRLLGSGIYGKVYLATEIATRRQLACKVVDLRVVAPASESRSARISRERTTRLERARLMREVDIFSMVNHPNIVSMQKAFRSENTLYLFMELAPGGDLCSYVSTNGGHLTDLTTRVIIRQIAFAVKYLHMIGIVHRDIKPENILMMNTAVGHRVVLTDFGCAANLNLGSRMESMVGTIDYVAPEVHLTAMLRGRSYTKAVDLWSLGIVALCLLTGESLASYQEMKNISQKDIAARLGRLGPDSEGQNQHCCLTDRAKDFLTNLLALDPADRMTADEALRHTWFTHSSKIARELRHLYLRSVRGWLPRRSIDNMVESIPHNKSSRDTIKSLSSQSQANSDELHQASRKKQRLSENSKDYTASVYFSLDKHTRMHPYRRLRGREATQKSKQQIINALRESGELFVKDGDVSSYISPRRNRSHKSLRGIRDVPPTDLFRKAPSSINSQQSQSKKSIKLSQYSGDVVTLPDYVDSSQSQLEQPSLPSEASSRSHSAKRRKINPSVSDYWLRDVANDRYLRPDSYAGESYTSASEYFSDECDVGEKSRRYISYSRSSVKDELLRTAAPATINTMQRGASNRGSRGTPAGARGSSFRGRGRGAARSSGSSNSTPEPTTENSFEAERNANAAKRAQRGQPTGGSASLRGTPEARGAFKNKTVRFSSPPAQDKSASQPQKPFVISKKPGSAPLKSKLSQTTNVSTSDPDDHTAKIEKTLQQNGLSTYPDWPTERPGDPSEKDAIKGFWNTTKAYRAKVRTVLMNKGLIDDPDKPKKLSEAIDFKGTCDGMCPRFEQITRIMEHDVKNLEKELAFDGSLWPAPQKMIKAYGRSSAGQDAPLPSDIRMPSALRKTLDYLIQDVLGDENRLATVHNFLWDRTRSIRRDFTFQQASLTAADYIDEVYCLETIARFHVIALHQMSDPFNTSDDFSEHQEIEQLGRTLLSLIHTYEDCKSQKIQCDNEAEFRAYFVIYHARNPAMMEAVQDWGKDFWESDEIQTATALVECLHNIWEINGPLKPQSASEIALNMYSRFFKIIRQPEVSYTTACFAEIHFNSVRKTALMTILSAYRKQREQTTDWTLPTLNTYLHFDTLDDAEAFIEGHGLYIKEGPEEAYLDFNSGISLTEPETKIKQPHSKRLVETKRGQKTLPACIYHNAFADAETSIADDSNSLFVSDFDGSHTFVKAPTQNQNIWGPSVTEVGKGPPQNQNIWGAPAQGIAKAPIFGTATPAAPPKRLGGFIDSDDEPTTTVSNPPLGPSTTTPSIFPSTSNPPAATPSFSWGAPAAPAAPPTTSFFPAPQTNNAAASPLPTQPNNVGTTSSIFSKQPGTEASSPFSFASTANQSQPAPQSGASSTPPFPQSVNQASTTSFFPGMQQTKPTTAGDIPSPSSVFAPATSPGGKPPPTTTQSPGAFSFPSQDAVSTQTTSLFAPKTGATEPPVSVPTGPSSLFPSSTQAHETPSPFRQTGSNNETNMGAVKESLGSAKPLFPADTSTGQAPLIATEPTNITKGARQSSSNFFPTIGSGAAQANIPPAPQVAQQQPALPSFGAINNTTPPKAGGPEKPPGEQVRYNWLAPPSSTKLTKPSISSTEKKAEAKMPQTLPMATAAKKQVDFSSTNKTVASNLTPYLAELATFGDGGILDQFTIAEVEKACRIAYDAYYEELESAAAEVVEEEKKARREADDFRQYSLGVKYFYRWRANAQKMWQRRRGRQARELRKLMAERDQALALEANEDIVEDFNKSLASSRSNKRKTEEDLLASSGVLGGIRNSTSKIRKVVHGDMAPPPHQRSTTPVGSPRTQSRFGRSTSSLGHSTSSLQSLIDADHRARSSSISDPNHKSSHKRTQSESVGRKAPLNMSVGGSRIHLMPSGWNPKDDKGPKPNNVQTDYFRLKARGIHTMPNGSPLASSAALHMRPSLINSVRQSMSTSGASGTSSGLATPDRQLKRSISKLSLSAPAKRFRADPLPLPKPSPSSKQEVDDIKANARRIMNEDASKRRGEEDRRRSLEKEKTRDDEMEELFRRSRKLKEDMAQGEEWFKKYNDGWSRSASGNSGSATTSRANTGPIPTSAPRNARPASNRGPDRHSEVIELD